MNKSLINQENNKSTPKTNFIDLLRPLAGALIGILLFATIFTLINSYPNAKSKFLMAVLLSPGLLTGIVLALSNDFGLNISSIGYTIILFSLSGIPYAIVGSLIFSKDKTTRAIGIIFLGIYLVTSFLLGSLALTIGTVMSD